MKSLVVLAAQAVPAVPGSMLVLPGVLMMLVPLDGKLVTAWVAVAFCTAMPTVKEPIPLAKSGQASLGTPVMV